MDNWYEHVVDFAASFYCFLFNLRGFRCSARQSIMSGVLYCSPLSVFCFCAQITPEKADYALVQSFDFSFSIIALERFIIIFYAGVGRSGLHRYHCA